MTNKEIFKKATYDSLDKQVGGKHYHSKNMIIDNSYNFFVKHCI